MIDDYGYRPNVGIIICNPEGRVFWGRRSGRDGWQFPQGGIHGGETPEQALFRELQEETGLVREKVALLGRTRDWLHYEIPGEYRRRGGETPFRGQKQIWFLLQLTGGDSDVRLNGTKKPEFDAWRWIEYWRALDEIVAFKRDVYRRAMTELEPLLEAVSGSAQSR